MYGGKEKFTIWILFLPKIHHFGDELWEEKGANEMHGGKKVHN